MREFITIFILAVAVLFLSAFSRDGKVKKIPKLRTFFACKKDGKIAMSAEQFMKLMSQPLCAKDSADSIYKVTRFEIIYAETGLYQDSAGLPIIHTDYTLGSFSGDTINHIWKKIFSEHTYRGDTIRFQNIRAKGSANMNFRSSNIEVILR